MKTRHIKRGIALALASLTLGMSVIPHLPSDILSVWAADQFRPIFKNSGASGHPNIYGTVPGEKETGFFCMNEGAKAKSGYLYTKVDEEVDYSQGTIEQKRLFWAYILTFGSAQVGGYVDDFSLERAFGTPLEGNTIVGKRVAWSKGKEASGIIEEYARDGFMQLESLPAGCKDPTDIFNVVSNYNTPEKALNINSIKAGPGSIDLKKLYDVAGIWSCRRF